MSMNYKRVAEQDSILEDDDTSMDVSMHNSAFEMEGTNKLKFNDVPLRSASDGNPCWNMCSYIKRFFSMLIFGWMVPLLGTVYIPYTCIYIYIYICNGSDIMT